MLLGGIVRSINDCGTFTFITIETDDKAEVKLTFRSDDPRVNAFRFRQSVTVELNTVTILPLKAIAR